MLTDELSQIDLWGFKLLPSALHAAAFWGLPPSEQSWQNAMSSIYLGLPVKAS